MLLYTIVHNCTQLYTIVEMCDEINGVVSWNLEEKVMKFGLLLVLTTSIFLESFQLFKYLEILTPIKIPVH